MNNSSWTDTSRPSTVVFSIRTYVFFQNQSFEYSCWSLTHCPTVQRQPMMELAIHEWLLINESANTVQFFKHTPSWIITRGPITTFGPIRHRSPILAVGSYWKDQSFFARSSKKYSLTNKTLPTVPFSRDNRSGLECRTKFK